MIKKYRLIIFALVFVNTYSTSIIAQNAGFFGTPISSVNFNGSEQTADAFNGSNLGEVTSLVLNGAVIRTFKNDGADVTGAFINYRIYEASATPGGFTEVSIPFGANLGGGGDQIWETNSEVIDVISDLTAGNYKFEVFFRISINNCCGGQAFQSNSGSNYIADFSLPFRSKSSTSWNTTATWNGDIIPTTGSSVFIQHNVNLNTNTTLNRLEINSGNTLIVNNSQTLGLSGGVFGLGTLSVDGNLQINSGGFTTIAPLYNSGSTLVYSTNNTYGRGNEWSADSGPGYPNNVTLTNNTILDLGANFGNTIIKQCAENLTIDSGSTMDMALFDMQQPLNVRGDFLNNGSIILSDVSGGDLFVGGNFTQNGILNNNDRAVFFDGGGAQTVTGTALPLIFDYVRVDKSGGTISFEENIEITQVAGGVGYEQTNGAVIVNAGKTFEVDDFVVNGGDFTLESNNSEYSSLLVTNATGEVTYNRFVNVVGTGAVGTGGNDLVSLPVMPAAGINFQELTLLGSPANSTKFAANGAGTLFAFGPYDNTSNETYVNYPSFSSSLPPDPAGPSPSETGLVKGKGYRAATTGGETISFVGAVETGDVSLNINTPSGGNQWNLVGNPYPSYMISAADNMNSFLADNANSLDSEAVAIYGYTSGTGGAGGGETIGNFTIINFTSNSSANIAPGQGFFLAADPADGAAGSAITFNADKRTVTGTDDFILGRNAENYNLRLQLERSSNTYTTAFYFNSSSTLGLDPGYDAAVFGLNSNIYPIYSRLVEDNTGRNMAIQSLGTLDLSDVSIPLGVHANQGQQISFSIIDSTLPSNIKVYLDDTVENTSTLLNNSDYILTPSTNVSGVGRFFLRYSEDTLSTEENSFNNLTIYSSTSTRDIVINGQLLENTLCNIYDIQGRLITSKILNHTTLENRIDFSAVSTGIYIVKLQNNNLERTQKVIIN